MAEYDRITQYSSASLGDTYAVKILICYFLNQINRAITPVQLTEIATGDGLVNHFVYADAINQLLEAKTVALEKDEESGEEYYVLSEVGKTGAERLGSIVERPLREKILRAGLKFFARLKNESFVKTEIIEGERGCTVYVKCTDGDITLMDLKLYAPDMRQAELLKEKIENNPADFYAKVLDFALDNEDYRPEPTEVEI